MLMATLCVWVEGCQSKVSIWSDIIVNRDVTSAPVLTAQIKNSDGNGGGAAGVATTGG